MPPLNPWLQRLLVAWAASTVTTGAILGSANNRYRPKKARRKRRRRLEGDAPARQRPPALPGTVAKQDAAEGYTPSLTWGEWLAAVKVRGERLVRFVTGQPPIGRVDDDGARVPDDVVSADGKKVRVAAPRRKGGAKRRGTTPPTRGRKRQQRQATLFESAKESLRQVVKEEAQKAVDEKVEEAGLGKAKETLQSAGEKVGKTAAAVAEKVKESIPEDLDEKVQTAGRSLFAGAKRAMQKLGESLGETLQALEAPPTPPLPADDVIEMTVEVPPGVAEQPPATVEPPPTESDVIDLLATMAALDGGATTPAAAAPPASAGSPDAATTTAVEAPTAPLIATNTPPPLASSPGADGGGVATIEGLDVGGIAEKVGDGVQQLGGGIQKLGAFLSGPGNPGYQRPGSRVRRAVGDVVEARDPTPPAAAPPSATPPSAPPPGDGPND